MSHVVLPPSVQPSKRETPGLSGPVGHPVVGRLWRLALPVAVGLAGCSPPIWCSPRRTPPVPAASSTRSYVPLGTWWRMGAVVGALNLTIWLVVGGAWTKLLGIW